MYQSHRPPIWFRRQRCPRASCRRERTVFRFLAAGAEVAQPPVLGCVAGCRLLPEPLVAATAANPLAEVEGLGLDDGQRLGDLVRQVQFLLGGVGGRPEDPTGPGRTPFASGSAASRCSGGSRSTACCGRSGTGRQLGQRRLVIPLCCLPPLRLLCNALLQLVLLRPCRVTQIQPYLRAGGASQE